MSLVYRIFYIKEAVRKAFQLATSLLSFIVDKNRRLAQVWMLCELQEGSNYWCFLSQEHFKMCQYEDEACADCYEGMERRFLHRHKTSECLDRIVQCEHCERRFIFRCTEVRLLNIYEPCVRSAVFQTSSTCIHVRSPYMDTQMHGMTLETAQKLTVVLMSVYVSYANLTLSATLFIKELLCHSSVVS